MVLLTEISIQKFMGNSIKPYLASIARVSVEILREYPYFYKTDLDNEIEYLKKYADCEESIAVLVFDGSTLIGASCGMPLEKESEEFCKIFRQKNLDVKVFFHLGESFLLSPYRGRGIGHHFFDLREEHAKKLRRFTHLSLCSVDRPEDDPERPFNHIPFEDFWRKRGYVHHREMRCFFSSRDCDENKEPLKSRSFWLREIH